MAYSERLASRIREILREGGDVDEKKMFGGLAFMVDGHMCCGVTRDDLMLRLGAEGAKQALEEPHVRPMDFTGRPMKGYVYVATPGLKTEAKLRRWLQLARDFVQTLPPKQGR
jgi:TfoX/Sxy family transcriptional regulator of competence genes